MVSLVFFHRDIAATFSRLPPLSKRLLLTILLLGITSTAIHNTHYKQSLLELGLFVLLFINILSVASIYPQLKDRFHKIILSCLLLTAGLHIVTAIGGYVATLIEPIKLVPHELFLNFSNPRFFNQLQSWTLPLIVLPILCLPQEKPYYKYFYISVAVGWWLLLFISGGRGTLLSISIAFILTIIIYRIHAKYWIKWQLISATSAFLLYLMLFYAVPMFSSTDSKTMLDYSALRHTGANYSGGRVNLWLNSLKPLQDDFLLGVGPMNLACGTANYYPTDAAHPHNALIQIAVEWGLPAALLGIFLFAWGCWCWIKKDKQFQKNEDCKNHQLISIALFSSLITAALHALFSGIIVMPHSQVTMVLVLGWMLGIYFHPQKQLAPPPTLTSAAFMTLTLISLFFLLIGMYPAMTTFSLDEMTISQLPRFWQQGQFCN